jgi:SAM-dependent methyltransferase
VADPVLAGWLDLLSCPADRLPLVDSTEGACCPGCDFRLTEQDGIWMARPTEPIGSEKLAEMHARDLEAPQYDLRFSPRRTALERARALGVVRLSAEQAVIELGAGTGRMTVHYLRRVRRTVALDLSVDSLRVLRDRLTAEDRRRVLLVQADVTAAPVRSGAFDRAVSFQVVEHLPTALDRQRAFGEVARVLSPGGRYAVTAYHWSRRKRHDVAEGAIARGSGREGHHAGGIFYRNFDPDELLALQRGAGLAPDLLVGLQVELRGIQRLGALSAPVDSFLGSTAFGRSRSHLLLVSGRPASAPGRGVDKV